MNDQEKRPIPYDVRIFKLLQDAADLMRYMDVDRIERVKPGKRQEWWQRYEKILRDASE